MIYKIFSDLPSFKKIDFHPGLNLLIADKSPGATDQQTRNRAGKTSIIEIIHFLLGSDCKPDSIFRSEKLKEFSFGMEFDLGHARTIVERSGIQPNKILVKTDNFEAWPILPAKKEDIITISNSNWRIILGAIIFGLVEAEDQNLRKKFAPRFRALFSYFARRERKGAFNSPMKQSDMQQLWDQQVALSYLLGLDWIIAQSWQTVREREKTLRELRKAVGEGVFGEAIGTVASLRTELTVAEEKIRRIRQEVKEFKILPQYYELESEASNLSQQLGKFSDENIIDRELIASIESSLEQEQPPALDDLYRLYQEAGILLTDKIKRHFDDLSRFHGSIIENRKSYLSSEIEEAKRRINSRDQGMIALSHRWSEIMALLSSHGALEQYSKLQSRLSKFEAETEVLRQRFSAAEQLEGKKTELDIERKRLLVRLMQDYQERKSQLSHAIIIFQEISSSLYENAGNLTISASNNGPMFEVKIQGKESKGINNMQIFCFDLMLIELCLEKDIGPRFLVHDSHLFDGVDERQIAKALQIGASAANESGFQYIVTMNSDDLPRELPIEFDLKDFILPIHLTDATETGGLFGLTF